MKPLFLFKLHFSSTLYMLGVICLIQVIHYPLFALVGKDQFIAYHAQHVRLTSVVIAIPMLIELVTLGALFYLNPLYRYDYWFVLSAFLLGIIWAVTFFVSVPQHNILSLGFDQKAWQVLVDTNWIRTICWGLRAILLFKFLKV